MNRFPVRIRGEVVAAVGHPVASLPDDFAAQVEKRLKEVLTAATDGFVSVYITHDAPPDTPTRAEEV